MVLPNDQLGRQFGFGGQATARVVDVNATVHARQRRDGETTLHSADEARSTSIIRVLAEKLDAARNPKHPRFGGLGPECGEGAREQRRLCIDLAGAQPRGKETRRECRQNLLRYSVD